MTGMLTLLAGAGLVAFLLYVALAWAVALAFVGAAAWVVKWVWIRQDVDELGRLRRLVLAMYQKMPFADGRVIAPVEHAAVQDDEIKEL